MNKYGGINDMPTCDKRVYGLWFQMLRCIEFGQRTNSFEWTMDWLQKPVE